MVVISIICNVSLDLQHSRPSKLLVSAVNKNLPSSGDTRKVREKRRCRISFAKTLRTTSPIVALPTTVIIRFPLFRRQSLDADSRASFVLACSTRRMALKRSEVISLFRPLLTFLHFVYSQDCHWRQHYQEEEPLHSKLTLCRPLSLLSVHCWNPHRTHRQTLISLHV